MKITFETRALNAALATALRAVGGSKISPILANIAIETEGKNVKFTGTDLDMALRLSIPAEVSKQGRVTAPAGMLSAFVAKLPEGSQASIEDIDNFIQIRAGRTSLKLATLPIDDFPEFVGVNAPTNAKFTLQANDALHLFARTAFAISTEETRYYLNGCYLHLGDMRTVQDEARKALCAVATNGHMLAYSEIDAPEGAEFKGVIVPRNAVDQIIKLAESAKKSSGNLHFNLSRAKIEVEHAGTRLVSKLIDGTFPDYGRVIPRNNNLTCVVDKLALDAALARVEVIKGKSSNGVALTFAPELLTLEATAEKDTAQDELEASFDDQTLKIGVNSQYLRAVIGHSIKSDLCIKLNDSGAPFLFEDDAALFVIMPMRV